MIFAEIDYSQHYADFHDELLAFITVRFPHAQSGLQGDSWIWISESEDKVAIDTFTSMKHQIKSAKASPLVRKLIEALQPEYRLKVYEYPEPEGHE